MARALHEGSTPEPVGNIQSEASRTFPAGASACEASSPICEQNLPVSHPSPLTSQAQPPPPSMCPRCLSSCQNQDRLEMVNSCESGPSSITCGRQRHWSYPESFSTGEPTAYGLRRTSHEHSNTGTEVEELHQDDPQAALPIAGNMPVEREIALRLRRIGDQMNDRYLRRRQVVQRQWWGPLRWHLTQMISEILAALYNPLVDILPQN